MPAPYHKKLHLRRTLLLRQLPLVAVDIHNVCVIQLASQGLLHGVDIEPAQLSLFLFFLCRQALCLVLPSQLVDAINLFLCYGHIFCHSFIK